MESLKALNSAAMTELMKASNLAAAMESMTGSNWAAMTELMKAPNLVVMKG